MFRNDATSTARQKKLSALVAAEADQIPFTVLNFPLYSLTPYCWRYQRTMLFLNLWPSKPPVLVIFLTCVQEVPGSNPDTDNDYIIFSLLSLANRVENQDLTLNYLFFSIYYCLPTIQRCTYNHDYRVRCSINYKDSNKH